MADRQDCSAFFVFSGRNFVPENTASNLLVRRFKFCRPLLPKQVPLSHGESDYERDQNRPLPLMSNLEISQRDLFLDSE
jgi:hypothetical protein